jgi:hypothetical protein
MRNAATPITLIIVGVLGVIWYFGWLPDIDSITSIALIAGGVAILAMDGITKSSIVLGPGGCTTSIGCAGRCSFRCC